ESSGGARMGAGGSAAIAAAAVARMRQQEEESMAMYTTEDLAGAWEFKFLRSATGEFKKPERLRAYLDEEAQAGGGLLGEVRSQRLRLKRPVSARANDGALSFDPYRTSVGVTELRLVFTIMGCVFLVIGAVIAIIAVATHKGP